MASNSLRFLNLSDDSSVDCTCDILDKEVGSFNYVSYMLDRTNQMFEYQNLPETIPAYMLELMLQTYGAVAITSINDNLYALYGHAGGPPDPYYRPTQFVVANVALGYSATLQITNHFPPFDLVNWIEMQHSIYFRNDTRTQGLIPLFARYATQMVENDISIRSAQINSRQQTLITATTGPEIESANEYIQNLEKGKLSNVATRPFIEGITVQNTGYMGANAIIQLIELQQYLKASWYNELGLNSNFNMKREYLSAEEIKASTDVLLPLVDDMLYCRQQAIKAINKEYSTNISVDKNSAWKNKQEESEMKFEEKSDSESEANENEPNE